MTSAASNSSKRALVTGASKGVGRGIALGLASAGWSVGVEAVCQLAAATVSRVPAGPTGRTERADGDLQPAGPPAPTTPAPDPSSLPHRSLLLPCDGAPRVAGQRKRGGSRVGQPGRGAAGDAHRPPRRRLPRHRHRWPSLVRATSFHGSPDGILLAAIEGGRFAVVGCPVRLYCDGSVGHGDRCYLGPTVLGL